MYSFEKIWELMQSVAAVSAHLESGKVCSVTPPAISISGVRVEDVMWCAGAPVSAGDAVLCITMDDQQWYVIAALRDEPQLFMTPDDIDAMFKKYGM